MRLFARLFSSCQLAALVTSQVLLAQAPASQASSDPKQMLTTAAAPIAVASTGAPPFRLKADFQTFDYLGKPAGTGTVEELFLSPEKRKITVVLEGKTYPYRIREDADPTLRASFFNYSAAVLMRALLAPWPTTDEINHSTLGAVKRTMGGNTFDCVRLEQKGSDGVLDIGRSSAFCMSGDTAVLRLAQLPHGFTTTYNRFVKFGGHYQAQDIELREGGVLRGKLTMTNFAPAPDLKETDLPSTPEAESLTGSKSEPRARPHKTVVAGSIIVKVQPEYPKAAKAGHISGSVSLHVVIGKDGSIGPIEVIGAPSYDLAEAALKAVRQWKYKPYLLDGAPTEVDTEINVNFGFADQA